MTGWISKTNPKALLAGICSALAAGVGLALAGQPADVCWTAAITLLCAIWWVTEALPLAATATVPIAILPLAGVLTPAQLWQAYVPYGPLVVLYLGGVMLTRAMEKSGAHRRLALGMVNVFGRAGDRGVVLGFMAAAALLSMWISNTATCIMLLPIALATLENVKEPRLKTGLLLGIAYACNIGGVGTPVGTPPNLIFLQVYQQNTGIALGFGDWMIWGLPVILVFVPLAALIVTRGLSGTSAISVPGVGDWRVAEKRTLIVFALTALAWITRSDPFGGWSTWFDLPGANDAHVAVAAVVLLFLVPGGTGGQLLDWRNAMKIPWSIVVLFGGGVCIANGFMFSGISQTIGEALAGLSGLHPLVVLASMCLGVTFLTEITSNAATTALLMPILAAAAIGANMDPRLMMVPAVMSASCAFMLPVATVPNAVVFASGHIPIRAMVRTGLVLNLIGVAVMTVVCYLVL